MNPEREDIIRMAREAGFKASVGKTDKDGVYHPDVNALGKDVPVEWLERLAQAAYATGAAAEREAGQKWFDAVTAQHKAEILAEREACAITGFNACVDPNESVRVRDTIRARGNE